MSSSTEYRRMGTQICMCSPRRQPFPDTFRRSLLITIYIALLRETQGELTLHSRSACGELAPQCPLLTFYNCANLVGKGTLKSYIMTDVEHRHELYVSVCSVDCFSVSFVDFFLCLGKFCFLHLCSQIYVRPASLYYSLGVGSNLYF